MSLYSEYIKERAGIDTLETENGFMSYRIQGKECFINDVYVRPEHRLTGEGARMLGAVIAIAKEQGCSLLTSTVCPMAKGSTESLKAVLASGFSLWESTTNLISFKREI